MKKLLSYGPGLVIGIPTLGRPVPLQWALALKSLNPPINFSTNFHLIENREVGFARNEMALNAIKQDAKYLFFIGDDVEIPNHALRSMIYKMEQDETIGVIGGVYCAKAEPAFPLVFRGDGQGSYWDWKVGEFFECTGLGMDCTIIRVSLLKELVEKKPKSNLFETVKSDKFLDGVNSAEEWTEDLFFLKRVREETSFRIFCDGGVICNHWDVYKNVFYTLPKDSLPMRLLGFEEGQPKLLDIDGMLTDAKGFNIVTFGPEGADYRGDVGSMPFDNGEYDAVNLPAGQLTNLSTIRPRITESVRVLKVGGEIKITHTNGLSQEWLCSVLKDLDVEVTKTTTSLIEGKKVAKG